MSLQGKVANRGMPAISLIGTTIATGVTALLKDADGNALLATGTTVPVDTGALYAKGCLFIDTDVVTGTSGLYENKGTAASCVFELISTVAAGDITDLTASIAEVNQLDSSANIAAMTPGAQITATAEAYKASTIRVGNVITTEIYIDVTGLSSIADDGDVIGFSTGAAHIGQVTTAVNGLIFSAKVACVEVPATGTPDINIASATPSDAKLDDDGTGLTGYILDFDSGGNLAIDGEEEFSTMPIANKYLYLLSGAGSGAGTYTAGKLVITLKGLVV